MTGTHRASRVALLCAARAFAGVVVAAALAMMAPLAIASVTPIDYYRMGETESGAPGPASATPDSVGGKTLTLDSAPFYELDAASTAVSATGSTTSMRFFLSTYGSASLLTTATDNVGLEAWVKPGPMPAGTHCLAYNGTVGANGFGLFINGASYEARIGSTGFGSAPVTTDQWVHLAVVRNAGVATLYVNGVAAGTSTAAMITPVGQFGVAASPPTFTNDLYFGRIDEMRAFTFAPGAFAPTDLLFAHRAVLNTNDSGTGSLRAAMTTAPAGTIVDIVTTGTVNLQGMLPVVTGALTINGPGAADFVIDGANQFRPFFIDAPTSAIAIKGVTMAHGRAKGGNGGSGSFTGGGGLGAGGALFVNRGDVALTDVAFVANQATGGNGGASSTNKSGSGGGGLGGDGGAAGPSSGSGGGGFLGAGGDSPGNSAGGGGGIYGKGGNSSGGGGGGGALTAGQDGQAVAGGAGADGLGGNGGDSTGTNRDGGAGLDNGGGGGGGITSGGPTKGKGGAGGRFGGGGGGAYFFTNNGSAAGAGGEFGGGGGTSGFSATNGGNGGWGGGGGGSRSSAGGTGGFGGGGGASSSSTMRASGGPFGGIGSAGFSIGGAGGGGGALGAAVFVRADNGATLTVLEPQFDIGTVTAGAAGSESTSNCGSFCAQGGAARGQTMFLLGGTTTLNVSAGTRTIAGTIGSSTVSPAALIKSGAGTLALSANSIELGNVSVAAGTLQVNGTLGSSLVSVASGATLGGTGTVAALQVPAGATLAPGVSVGTLSAGVTTLSGAGNYNWQLRDATAAAGVGYDSVNVNGTLDVSAASNFKINLWTLSSTAPETSGPASNFDPEVALSWTLIHTTGGITGFNAANFAIITAASNGTGGFVNANAGSFSLSVVGNDLVLSYKPPQEIAIEQPVGTNVVDGGSRSFGASNIGIGKTLTFSVFNRGAPDLLLTGTPKVVVSGANAADFVVTTQPVSPVTAAGGGTTFDVRFTPSAAGARSAALSIANNDANENPFDILLSGTGAAPEIDVEQPAGTPLANGGSRNVGAVVIGSFVSNTFLIRNSGTGSLDGIGASLSGADAAEFSITAAPAATVAAGASTTLSVKFTPVTTGAKTATLSIASNDADENPYLINLTGSAEDTDIAVEQPAGSALPDGSLRYLGNVSTGANADFVFTIRNTGSVGALTGLGISINGTDAALFSVVSNPTAPVAAGGSTTFTLRFAPTTRGIKSANLHIASNDPDESPYDIALSANSISPEIGVDQPVPVDLPDGGSRDFGSVAGAATVSRDFALRNGGNTSLTLGAIAITGANAGDFSVTQQPASVIGEASDYGNASFETPTLSAGTWSVSPTGAQWTFGARAGIARSGSPWFVNAPPDGTQAAYIQVLTDTIGSKLGQPVTFMDSGVYLIRFSYVRRGSGYAGTDIDVRIDGATLGTVLASAQTDDTWREFVVPYTNTTAGATHTLEFVGTLLNGDRATAIDNVRIEGTSVMTVSFTPHALGARSATLSIPNNDTDENPFDIQLTGTGGQGNADLQVTVTNNQSDLYAGENTVYAIKALNAGPDSVANLIVFDLPSDELNNAYLHWTCTSSPVGLCPNASGNGNLGASGQRTTQPLPSGAFLQYRVFAKIIPTGSPFGIGESALVVNDDPAVQDANSANDNASDYDPLVDDGIFRNGFE